MNPDYDKASADTSDGWSVLIIVAVLCSAAIHVGLMVGLSDCPFAPLPMEIKNDRHWTKDLPVMQMQKMAEDPLAVDISAESAPPGPPFGTNFSRRKEDLPLPPSPAFTLILLLSMNCISF